MDVQATQEVEGAIEYLGRMMDLVKDKEPEAYVDELGEELVNMLRTVAVAVGTNPVDFVEALAATVHALEDES